MEKSGILKEVSDGNVVKKTQRVKLPVAEPVLKDTSDMECQLTETKLALVKLQDTLQTNKALIRQTQLKEQLTMDITSLTTQLNTVEQLLSELVSYWRRRDELFDYEQRILQYFEAVLVKEQE